MTPNCSWKEGVCMHTFFFCKSLARNVKVFTRREMHTVENTMLGA